MRFRPTRRLFQTAPYYIMADITIRIEVTSQTADRPIAPSIKRETNIHSNCKQKMYMSMLFDCYIRLRGTSARYDTKRTSGICY